MALGYALLHRSKIETALESSPKKQFMDEALDIALGAMSAGSLGEGLDEFLDSKNEQFRSLFDEFASLGDEDGPLGFMQDILQTDIRSVDGLTSLINRMASGMASVQAASLREMITNWVDRFLDALPDLSGDGLKEFVDGQLDDLIRIFEYQWNHGERTKKSHRSFRAAVTIRQLFGSMIDSVDIPTGDLKQFIRDTLVDALSTIESDTTDSITDAFSQFSEQYGGLFRALEQLGGSASASVSVGGDSPDGMPDETGSFRDEIQAVPHTSPKGERPALWVLDLVTNSFNTFNLIWEFHRTRNWKDREADGIFSILIFLWQAAHTVVRAGFESGINSDINVEVFEYNAENPNESGEKFVNWFFTDQGNLTINFFLRLFGSFYDKGASNWALSFAQRMLKYYTSVVNFRAIYWYARSVDYLKNWRENGFYQEDGEQKRVPVSMVRVMWAVWAPWMWSSICFSLFMSWDQFSLENMWTARSIVLLALGNVVGITLGYATTGMLMGGGPGNFVIETAWTTLLICIVLLLIGILAIIFILSDIESNMKWLAILVSALIIALVAVPLVILPFAWGGDDNDKANKVGSQWLIFVAGLFLSGILNFFLWWWYIDDGRDKLGVFEGKSHSISPYLLPYPKNENWLCGQGCHGIFSHVVGDDSNHYAYDFNENEFKHGLAARAGIVINIEDSNPNKRTTANHFNVQHLDWVEHHDPGNNLERVLTRATYYHVSQHRIWADDGHRVDQGYYVTDIDSTGISAQHHLHFASSSYQSGSGVNMPVVFKDKSLESMRNYPLLAFIKGKGHIKGKPISMAYYRSDNEPIGPKLNPVVLRTTVEGGHYHELNISRKSLNRIIAITPGETEFIYTAAAIDDTMHTLETTKRHTHKIRVDMVKMEKLLALKELDSVPLEEADGHTHTLERHRVGLSGGTRDIDIVQPPGARLSTSKASPYNLAGDQWIVRVDERATEYFFYGANRPMHFGELALDRGLKKRHTIRIDTHMYSLGLSFSEENVEKSIKELNEKFRNGTPPAPSVHAVVRMMPVVVLETKEYGKTRSVSIGGTASLIADGEPSTAQGSGYVNNGRAVTGADLAAHINDTFQHGWGSAPGGLTASIVSGQLQIEKAGSTAVQFTDSYKRIETLFTKAYDTTNKKIFGAGDLPMNGGRIKIDSTFEIPLLVSPAQIKVDTTRPAFSELALVEAKPLKVTVLGVQTEIVLEESTRTDGAFARKVAGQITQNVEGLRAWNDGDTIIVQTIAGGTGVRLEIEKDAQSASDDYSATGQGDSAALVDPAHPSPPVKIDDSSSLRLDELRILILDSVQRATVAAAITAAGPQASFTDNKIKLEVGSGHNLEVLAGSNLTADDPFNFPSGTGRIRESQVLSNPTISLLHTGWLDIAIDGHAVRIPLDSEPARLECGPFTALPKKDETLSLTINGASPVSHTFGDDVASVEQLIGILAQQSPDITVRRAWIASVENSFYEDATHDLYLNDSPGLSMLGFLGDRNGFRKTDIARGRDNMAVSTSTINQKYRTFGELVPEAITLSDDMASGKKRWKCLVSGGYTIDVEQTNPDNFNPLNLRSVAANRVETLQMDNTLSLQERQCVEYSLIVREAPTPATGSTTPPPGDIVARSRFQIRAMPAAIRTKQDIASPFAPVSGTTLPITVTIPSTGSTEIEQSYSVDVTGISTLEDFAFVISNNIPLVRAWVVNISGNLRLHIETFYGGTGWKLSLGNPGLLLELGFDQEDITFKEEKCIVAGRGDVRNSQAVTRDEVENILTEAIKNTTGLLDTSTSAMERLSIQLRPQGNSIVAKSLHGQVTVMFGSTSRNNALSVTVNTTTAETGINGSAASVALDCGTIVLKINNAVYAAAPVWGQAAKALAHDPLPVPASSDYTDMLNLLWRNKIQIVVDSYAPYNLGPVPVPQRASLSTIEKVLQWYGERAPGCVIGIEKDGSDKHVFVQSKMRGRNSHVKVNFQFVTGSATYPSYTILGFTGSQLHGTSSHAHWFIDESGAGSVDNLSSVPVTGGASSLEGLLEDAIAKGATNQTAFEAKVDGSDLKLQTPAQTYLLENASSRTQPGNFSFSPSGTATTWNKELSVNYAGDKEVANGLFELEVIQRSNRSFSSLSQMVQSLIAGNPARVPSLQFPDNLGSLNNKGFDIRIDGQTFVVVLRAPASVTKEKIAMQIQLQCDWKIVASIDGNTLLLESLHGGSATDIQVGTPAAATTYAITNDLTPGFVSTVTPSAHFSGSGTVPNVKKVSKDDYKDAIEKGFISYVKQRATSNGNRENQRWLAYTGSNNADEHYILSSSKKGVASSIIPVSYQSIGLGTLDKSFERAPAINAAVVLPQFSGDENVDPRQRTVTLNGHLWIAFNDNGGAADLPTVQYVDVLFNNGSYTPQQVAQRINKEIVETGIGYAGVYADGRIVIETGIAGLAGTVSVPAPSSSGHTSTAGVVTALVGDESPLSDRGWPGAGKGNPGSALGDGFRSGNSASQASADWVFKAGTLHTAAIAINNGESLEDIKNRVHTALGAVGTPHRRIGICVLGEDGTLYIEETLGSLSLEVNGSSLGHTAPTPPLKLGETTNRDAEPAIDLRKTNEIRTVRVVRHNFDLGDTNHVMDAGWVRVPADSTTGDPRRSPHFPLGRYNLSGRTDAAKTREYHLSGDMIRSAGTSGSDDTHHCIHTVNHWIRLGSFALLGVKKVPVNIDLEQYDYLADFIYGW